MPRVSQHIWFPTSASPRLTSDSSHICTAQFQVTSGSPQLTLSYPGYMLSTYGLPAFKCNIGVGGVVLMPRGNPQLRRDRNCWVNAPSSSNFSQGTILGGIVNISQSVQEELSQLPKTATLIIHL